MKKVFLDNLPKRNGGVDWKKCEGKYIHFIYDDIDDYVLITKFDNGVIFLSYKDIDNFKIHKGNFKKCTLGKLLNRVTGEFKFKIGQILNDEKRNITIIDRKRIGHKNNKYINYVKYYKYKCNNCGFECGKHYRSEETKEEHWIAEGELILGCGCSCCCLSPSIVVEGINDIPTTAPWMVKYFQGGYGEAKKYCKSSGKKVYSICPDCRRISKKRIAIRTMYREKSIGCSCGDGVSYPNKFMYNLLEQLYLEFINEYSPDWIKPKRYDFYIPSKNLIIEMDGGFHYVDNEINGQKKEEIKSIDKYKDLLGKQHNVDIIRIKCLESSVTYIKQNIINSRIADYFDLSSINWDKCDEFALKNLVKEVCKYYNNNILSTQAIASNFNLSKTTVIKYLHKGNKLGWCDYNPNEKMKKSAIKSSKACRKEVVCLDNHNTYKSLTFIQNNSQELFGCVLRADLISLVCRNKKESYKGYHFRFVSDLTEEEKQKYGITSKSL